MDALVRLREVFGDTAYFWSHPGNANGSNNWVEARNGLDHTLGVGQTERQALSDAVYHRNNRRTLGLED